ncbi:ABC transporter ATP-binding protein [Natronobacterium texcoconense]|uniref:Peptide/nickel transport system ATP-binding protein n=1 Tax=Natronobacterium texcoconense TaxID=1095778 RepID=A0A1H0YWM9_NATTX|nr:oligopeptide/dipeptide ABC transporter ATP-binding protein [Natronobacterium texcoconense]SDQ19544.1 peptide/nickel transport system ATP-binding protein [Natronobacterium texcoconense]
MTDPSATDEPILTVEDLKTHYPIHKGWLRREVGRIRAVDGVSFNLRRGEALGLVGESGSGKSTVARTIMGLETATDGEIRFGGTPVDDLEGEDRRAFQRRVQLVVQNPDDAFSPRMTVGEAVAEPLRLHGMDDADRRRAIVADLLERVGLSAADADRHPHEFSGGEKQRIAIARALVVNPDLIVADEPASALDSRVKSDVLALLDRIRREYDVSVLFISHDIDAVRMFCDRVAVMYLGEIVERGPIDEVLDAPAHPYTRVLLRSVPSLDPTDRSLGRPLTETIPDPADPPDGCSFHTRCPEVIPPTNADLSPETWTAVAAFRFTLETGEFADHGQTDTTIRERFGLPDPIPDDDLERAVDDAITAVTTDDHKRAAARLADTIETVCERCSPETVDHDGRPVACHRYDPEIDADPRPWSDD